MGVITKEVEVKVNSRNVEYYKSLGYEIPMKKSSEITRSVTKKDYVYDIGKTFIVKIEDLQKGSDILVDVLCDMCKEEIMSVSYNIYNRVVKKTGDYVCKKCARKKAETTNLKRFNVPVATQSELIRNKIKETNMILYGVDNYTKTSEYKERFKQTCLGKYGVEHISQSEEIKNKKRETCLERYGVEYSVQSKEIRKRQLHTLYNNYGVTNPMYSPIIKENLFKTMYENGTMIASRQQRYLCNIYNGELNYPIKFYAIDICLLDEKIAIEYDGSGHDLQVQLGNMTKAEFNQKEIVRFNIIKREGYKQMRIISRKDLLPSDKILLQMLSMAKEYFDTTSHTWMNFDIDNSIMINAENKSNGGIYFDYGKLRRIKEVA